MFEPRLALASLSGASDSTWARTGAPYAGAAFLGGIAVCETSREAARAMVERDRKEFLPDDPVAFVDEQLAALADVDIRPGVNVRTVDPDVIPPVARVCSTYDAIYEVNAHCRQDELCAVGAGETLLADTERLVAQVQTAALHGPTVCVKVRAEVPGVDLTETARAIADAGADAIHVDAMDSETVIADVKASADLFVIANNGVRDRTAVTEYVRNGADAVSVGRPSDNPTVLDRIRTAVDSAGFGSDPIAMRNDR